jgi:hypothetical protein
MGRKKIKKREVVNVDIIYKNQEDITNLFSKKEFIDFVLKNSLEAINYAVENNLDEIQLFNIIKPPLHIKLEKLKFKPILEYITKYYVEDENYDKCIEIRSLIEKI